MKDVMFDQKRRDEWNHFAERSGDAWFWHTSDWMDYTEELSKEVFLSNLSFYIVENSNFGPSPLLAE